MRLIVVLVWSFLFLICVNKLCAQQEVISLDLENVSVEYALNTIEVQSGYYFLFNQNLINTNMIVSVDANDLPLEEVLHRIFDNLDISFTVYGRQIILLPRVDVETLVSSPFQYVTGRIRDVETGEVMPGVNIRVGGTNIGTVTDNEGCYRIGIPDPYVSLVYSFIGYRTLETSAEGRPVIDMEMVPLIETLEEVVIVGYGVQNKSVVTGAISKLESRNLVRASITRAEQGLQGRLPGVQVIANSGAPGAGLKLRIRGYGSNGISDPLYIVDGLRVNNIDYITPDDISSIEILKDAASAAIYGSEGANGVVLISTLRGSENISTVTYSLQHGWQGIIKKPDVMDASQFSNYMKEAGLISDSPMSYNTKWLDQVFETSPFTKHHLSFAGGSERMTFLLSLGYLDNNGIVVGKKDRFRRYNLMFNTDYEMFQWLKISSNTTYANTQMRAVSENSEYGSVITNALMMDPLTPVNYAHYMPSNIRELVDDGKKLIKDDRGCYYGISDYVSGEIMNPLATLQLSHNQSVSDILTENINVEIVPYPGFAFTSRLGFVVNVSNLHSYLPEYYYNDRMFNSTSQVSDYNTIGRYWQWENFATYHLSHDDHNMDLLAGMSSSEDKQRYTGASGGPLTKDAVEFAELSFISSQTGDQVTGTETISRKLSYFARLFYDYKSKYLIQFSLRKDAASSDILPPDKRWGTFPSVSAGWIITKEPFFPQVRFIGEIKIRVSWGQNGSLSNLGNYQYSSNLLSTSVYPIHENDFFVATASGRLGNQDLTWETSEQTDIGLDLALFNNRMTFTVDFYHKQTKNLITQNTPPLESGNVASPINAGSVLNRGIELSISYMNRIGEFSYAVEANLSTLHNEVTYLNPNLSRLNGTSVNLWTATSFEKGKPIWYFRGYRTKGIDHDTGEPVFVNTDGVPGINEDDKTYIGSGIPKMTFGTSLNLSYKGFDFALFFQGQSGNDIIMGLIRTDRPINNKLTYFYWDRWTTDNQDASKPAAGADPKMWNSDLVVFDGSYIRAKQIQLGYRIPGSWLDKIGISYARLYVSMDDFFTFTRYPGIDPEGGSILNNSIGIDRGMYPVSRKILLGASITL